MKQAKIVRSFEDAPKDLENVPGGLAQPAQPVVRRQSWTRWLVWLVPLLAAVALGFYVRSYLSARGPLVTIRIESAEGIKDGQTVAMYRGVPIGVVSGIRLSDDHRAALVDLRLVRGQEAFARDGADFWIVKPEVTGLELQGFGTLLSGPYFEARPGASKGALRKQINAIAHAPQHFEPGTDLVLKASRIDHLQDHSPVYYRGMQVGEVRDVKLAEQSDVIEARIVVWRKYTPLVHRHSRFWSMSGIEAHGGLFSGVDIKFQSVKALVAGGVAFATPEKPAEMGALAKAGESFTLESDMDKDWLKWSPRIPLRAGRAPEPESAEEGSGLPAGPAGGITGQQLKK